MQNTGLYESQGGIKIARRNINNFRNADDNTVMAESKEELKNLLVREKVENEKAGIKQNKTQNKTKIDHGIQSQHFMANRKGKSGSSDIFYFGGLQNHCRGSL